MRVVTTVHKKGFEDYGYRWIEGIKNWPAASFVMYAEGFLPEGKGIETQKLKPLAIRRTEDLPRLQAFKEKHKDYRPISWEWDIVRFSNKVFAAYDAFYDYDGIGVWLDADCVTHNKIPEGYIEGLLDGAYMGQFNRTGFYTETGFWVVDCSHPQHKAFFDTWLQWFESGAFKDLQWWHDCTTLDAVTRKFVKEGLVTITNLSGEHSKQMHPISYADLGKYCDHTKGNRKSLGYSPENKFRKRA